ncbi:universal stress protein [Streptomyces sp. NPDC006967]|uniref:universal stress protein n=1 Tax=Streptomyces sp. NPDC006967 TaxID=3156906 RepID=UPI0033F278C0
MVSALPSGKAETKVFLEEAEHAHAVVLGAKGEGGFGNLMLGSVSLQVVGHAASPVIIVDHITTGHRRVVVGADGSPHSTAALDYAFQAASLRKARLLVLHAWSMPCQPEPPVLIDPDPDEIAKKHQHELEEQISGLRKRYPEVEVTEELIRDAPVPALTRASDRADLLVLGSRGRGGFHGLRPGVGQPPAPALLGVPHRDCPTTPRTHPCLTARPCQNATRVAPFGGSPLAMCGC